MVNLIDLRSGAVRGQRLFDDLDVAWLADEIGLTWIGNKIFLGEVLLLALGCRHMVFHSLVVIYSWTEGPVKIFMIVGF